MPRTKTAYDEYVVQDTFEMAVDMIRKSRKDPGKSNLGSVLRAAEDQVLANRMELQKEEIQRNRRDLLEAVTEWDQTRKPLNNVKWARDEALRWKA